MPAHRPIRVLPSGTESPRALTGNTMLRGEGETWATCKNIADVGLLGMPLHPARFSQRVGARLPRLSLKGNG